MPHVSTRSPQTPNSRPSRRFPALSDAQFSLAASQAVREAQRANKAKLDAEYQRLVQVRMVGGLLGGGATGSAGNRKGQFLGVCTYEDWGCGCNWGRVFEVGGWQPLTTGGYEPWGLAVPSPRGRPPPRPIPPDSSGPRRVRAAARRGGLAGQPGAA